MIAKSCLVICLVLLGLVAQSSAADKKIKLPAITPSKVDRSKNKEREKLFGAWMSSGDFKLEVASRAAKREKLLYFECEGAKDQWRGIFVPQVGQENPYFMAVFGEKSAAQRIAEYAALGFTPRFIVVNKNYWCFTLSQGTGTESETGELANLGISAPVVK